MKKLSRQKTKKVYDALQKNRKGIKRRSMLFAIFVLGVNAYAWFIFITKADVQVDSNVVAWDVSFLEDNVEVKETVVQTVDLYPGMPTYSKTFSIANHSELPGVLSYNVDSVKLMGVEELPSEYINTPEAINYLHNKYPFYVTFVSDATEIAVNETINFTIKIDWPYEATDTGAKQYYQATPQYIYDDEFKYYTSSGGGYTPVNITEAAFNNAKSSYYLEKDDADSFWGMNCDKYKTANSKPCFSFHLIMTVNQKK